MHGVAALHTVNSLYKSMYDLLVSEGAAQHTVNSLYKIYMIQASEFQ